MHVDRAFRERPTIDDPTLGAVRATGATRRARTASGTITTPDGRDAAFDGGPQ